MKLFLNKGFNKDKSKHFLDLSHSYLIKYTNISNNLFYTSNLTRRNFSRTDFFYESDIQKKLKEKFENKNAPKQDNLGARYTDIRFDKIENQDLADLLRKYVKHVTEREKRRLNFNRKDRWKQRELDDIMKNFDVQQAKFKDYSKLSREANIANLKEFKSIEEIYFYLDEILKDGFLEEHIGMALDVFIKDIKFFKSEDINSKQFKNFVSQLAQNIISLNSDSNIYKTAKFLDWYNIDNKNCWYNLERLITYKKDKMNREILLKILDHFAHQNEGSIELYDMYQYLFWSDDFKDVSNGDFISLGYNLFITRQGYTQFFYDYYGKLLPRISHKDSTFDLLKVVQTFSEISEFYMDAYKKIEDIILSRYEQLELSDATVIACAYAVAGMGSDLFYEYMEKIIIANFNNLDKQGFREAVRALIVSLNGSEEFFEMINHNIQHNVELFNLTELVYIIKAFHEKNMDDKNLYDLLERKISENLSNSKDVMIEEICAIADCVCSTKVFSREFQKLFELTISQRMKDIAGNPKVCKFLYNLFYTSGMCSVGLMNVLHKAYTI